MRNFKYIFLLQILAIVPLLSGCQDEDESTYIEYVNVPLSTHHAIIVQEEVSLVEISIPSTSYSVESDNPEIAKAELVDNVILLTGGNVGKTLVRLRDEHLNRALLEVEVLELLDLELESLPGNVEKLRLFNDGSNQTELKVLSGNGGYTIVNSHPECIDAQIVENSEIAGQYKLVLKGEQNVEDATITVIDSQNKQAEVKVRVTDPVSPIVVDCEDEIEGEYNYGGTMQQISFTITQGNGGYEVTSSCENVATVSINGQTVTVTIVGDGGSTITVRDKEDVTKEISLWVPLNLDDPTPRIYWDGYKAIKDSGISTEGSNYGTTKQMYFRPNDKDYYFFVFNGAWTNEEDCVSSTKARTPRVKVVKGGVTTEYKKDDGTLKTFVLEKNVSNKLYYISASTADGKKGFIVHQWE